LATTSGDLVEKKLDFFRRSCYVSDG